MPDMTPLLRGRRSTCGSNRRKIGLASWPSIVMAHSRYWFSWSRIWPKHSR